MKLNIEYLLIGYFLLSLIFQMTFSFFGKERKFSSRFSQLMITVAAICIYLLVPTTQSLLHIDIDSTQMMAIGTVFIINSALQIFGEASRKIDPVFFNFLNLFSFVAFSESNLSLVVICIIAIKFCDIIMAMYEESKRNIASILHQFIRLSILSVLLFSFLIAQSFVTSGPSYIDVVAKLILFSAVIVDGGLFTLRFSKRIEINSIDKNLLYIRMSSVNFSTLISLLFVMNRLQAEYLHLVAICVLIVTLAIQLFGILKVRSNNDLISRLYLMNLSFVLLIFSFAKESMVLMNALAYAIALHLIIPMAAHLLHDKHEQERFGQAESLLLATIIGWLTILPLPFSLFSRMSLMILNGGLGNGIFYGSYFISLAVAFYVALQAGKTSMTQFRSKPSKKTLKHLLPYWGLMLVITVAGTMIGAV